MDANEKYRYWRDAAKYDLDTAEAAQNSGRWLYVVFMCQQAIEKICKELYILYLNDDVPHIHNIRQIIGKYADQLPEQIKDDHFALFDKLTAFYLKGRYPEYKKALSEITGKREASEVLSKSKEVFAWLLTMKP